MLDPLSGLDTKIDMLLRHIPDRLQHDEKILLL